MSHEIMPLEKMIENMAVVNLQPGDLVVVQTKENLTANDKKYLASALEKYFPHNEVIVLDKVVEFGVVRFADIKAKLGGSS